MKEKYDMEKQMEKEFILYRILLIEEISKMI